MLRMLARRLSEACSAGGASCTEWFASFPMSCRQRQKATISNLEAELTQKLAELQMLSEENEMLKLRSEVLEAVTSGREYQVRATADSQQGQLLAGGWSWLLLALLKG